MSKEPWVGLADAVSAIRAELLQAMDEGRKERLQFRAGPVEMEFTVEVKKEGEGRAKVFVLPWTAEGRAAYASGNTNRLKVTLQPLDTDGTDARISAHDDERPK